MSLPTNRRRPAPILAAVVVALLAASAARSATYTITTLVEDTDVNGNCTLREALLAASTDSTNDACLGDLEPDTIVLEAVGSYALDDGTVSSAARQLTVRGAAGQPPSAYVVDLGGVNRFLSVSSGSSLTIENLTLSDGLGTDFGGAVRAEDSDLSMRDVVVSSSEADNGGAVAFRTFEARRLEIEGATFSANRATADQAFGGALFVDLQGAGSARIVASKFLDNRIDSATGTFARRGGGLAVQSFGGESVELRHLRFERNVIAAPSFAIGGGASLNVTTTAAFVLEDALFVDNEQEILAATNGASGLDLSVDAPAAAIRRLRLAGNLGTAGRNQAVVQVENATEAVVSDLLVVDGPANGLFLASSGTTCSLVAGNLTVAGHPGVGLQMSEASCPLRIESSILSGNGTNQQTFSGSPEISPETLVGGVPGFVDAGNGDYRLAAGSVAVGAGDASFASVGPFDAAHGPRVVGAELDLGALERGAIFADDFEHGDAWAWSATTGVASVE